MSGSSSTSRYRPDIDGLRAIAVLAVVAYHAGLGGFTGGFIGVDVFFVISGFLITRLLLDELAATGTLSFAGFYGRRMRRLLPALAVVILATLAAHVFLFPGFVDARKLAASIRWSAFGFGNVFFRRNTGGYFDGATDEMPLLHLWSLGVEEQFYLCWPLLLWALRKSRQGLVLVLGGTVIASFVGAAVLLRHGDSAGAFYLMPWRAWELGTGALLACWPSARAESRRSGFAIAFAGLGLILGAAIFYTPATPFPGPAALLPILGSMLLIRAGEVGPRNPVSSILSTRPWVRIGLLSYGWYLWHWPLLVAVRLWNLGMPPALAQRLGALGLSLLLAELSLRWVERPLRRGRFVTSRGAYLSVAGGLAASAALVAVSFPLEGVQEWLLSSRLGPRLVQQLHETTSLSGRCFSREEIGSPACRVSFARSGKPSALLAIWGDSHACSYFPMLESEARDHGLDVAQYCQGETPPLLGGGNAGEVLAALRQEIAARAPAPVSVVLASRWVAYTGRRLSPLDVVSFPSFGREEESVRVLKERLAETYPALKAAGVSRVLVVLPSPEFRVPAFRCLWRGRSDCTTARADWEGYRGRVVQAIRDSAAGLDYVRLIDPVDALCDGKSCPQVKGGVPLAIDTNHPTVRAAVAVGDFYAADLRWLAGI